MDALTAQLASLPLDVLTAMAAGALYPSPRLLTALRVATAREATNRNAEAFPALRWVSL